jgi:hypothetical protein
MSYLHGSPLEDAREHFGFCWIFCVFIPFLNCYSWEPGVVCFSFLLYHRFIYRFFYFDLCKGWTEMGVRNLN